jgi:hypothetical protein
LTGIGVYYAFRPSRFNGIELCILADSTNGKVLLFPASLAEIMEQVDGVIFDHSAQLAKAFVGLRVSVEDLLRDALALSMTSDDDTTRIREMSA